MKIKTSLWINRSLLTPMWIYTQTPTGHWINKTLTSRINLVCS